MGANEAAAGSNAQKTTLKKHAVVCLFFPSLNMSLSLEKMKKEEAPFPADQPIGQRCSAPAHGLSWVCSVQTDTEPILTVDQSLG